VVTLGVVAYGVNIESAKLPAMAVALVLGATAFATWGVALTAFTRTAAAAPALANAVLLPLAFVSNVFVSFEGEAPAWLLLVGDAFPLRHFVISFGEAMSPFSEAPAFVPDRLGVLVAWTVVGALVAWRGFRWEPAVGASSPRSRRGNTR